MGHCMSHIGRLVKALRFTPELRRQETFAVLLLAASAMASEKHPPAQEPDHESASPANSHAASSSAPKHAPAQKHKPSATHAKSKTASKPEAKAESKPAPGEAKASAEGKHPDPHPGGAEDTRRGTDVCGTYKLPQEWTLYGSPYRVTGDVFIPFNSQLRIEAGVEIRFSGKSKPCPDAKSGSGSGAKPKASGHGEVEKHSDESDNSHEDGHDSEPKDGGGHGEKTIAKKTERDPLTPPPPKDFSDSVYTTLTVEGAFYCIGTPKHPVRFLPADTSRGEPPWDAVRVLGQREGRAEVAFAEFHGANIGLYTERSDFFIHHCLFEDNNTGLWTDRRGDVTVLNSVFARNRSTGLYIETAAPHVANSVFWENRGYGIWADGHKVASLEYNAFQGNAEEDCYRCAHDVLPLGEGGAADSTDKYGNRRADPYFVNSSAFLAKRAVDPRYDTPDHLVKDTAMAAAEKRTRWKWWKKQAGSKEFKPRGTGPYVLSEYSSLIQAGHPARGLRNTDGSRGDIGLWGGPQERITKDPFAPF